jgi:hypothetical protein
LARNGTIGFLHLLIIAGTFSLAACSAQDAPAAAPPIEPYPAASSDYRLESFEGIALEVPSHWEVLDSDTRKNLKLSGEQRYQSAFNEEEAEDKETVLAMNSKPSPHGSMIRVSRNSSMAELTSDAIYNLSSAELVAASSDFESLFKSVMPEFVSMLSVEKVIISGTWALKISYMRQSFGPNKQDMWQVDQYMVPSDSGTVWQVTLSRRVRDRIVWDPILERVKRTIRLK